MPEGPVGAHSGISHWDILRSVIYGDSLARDRIYEWHRLSVECLRDLGASPGLDPSGNAKIPSSKPELREEILQEAQIALSRALETYRADSGFAFSTYATHQIRWRVYRFLSQFTRKDASTDSLNEPQGECDDEGFTLADVADRQTAARSQSEFADDERRLKKIDDLREAIRTCATLMASEREILKAFLESGNGGVVAASLGITPARVSQALSSAPAKLRKHFRGSGS